MTVKSIKRKLITVSESQLIKTEVLCQKQQFSLVIQPAVEGVNLTDWAVNNRHWIEEKLLKYSALLFRDFDLTRNFVFEHFIQSISSELIEYSYGSTPRTLVTGKIYTSTEYPAEQFIPLHNEMAYSLNWPMKIWFFCVKVAAQGGETPIADSRKIFQRIDTKIKERFIDKKVMYVRNYLKGIDLDWRDVFQTTNKVEVESYCRKAGIEFEWKSEDHLRTTQVCQAIAIHPQTGDRVWFNQAHLFHVSSLQTEVRESLLSAIAEENLPRNAFYGDGSPIESSTIEEINEIYQQEAITFPWKEGDILMLDNMLVAHGRKPFVGTRKVLVGMADAFSYK
ncbi:TauD/TfdA family dioxygenase [Candidatus Gracilibacteria bacterium]|nr:TauD/TfdA family dioxygenase [Candidatus Gracilibacteria bacterium]NJP21133.1 TauD/TfdA family dioxygenase [Hydrococcus sp. CRU_1_1]